MKKLSGFDKGFTLVELMMTVTIVLIITALSIYNLLAELPSYRLRSTAHELAAAIQYIKIRAVTTNRLGWIEVNYASANDNYFTGFVDDPPGGTTTAAEYNNSRLDFPDVVNSVPCIKLPPTIRFGFPSAFSSGNGPDASPFPGAGRYISTFASDSGDENDGFIGYRPTGIPVINPGSPQTASVPMVVYLTNTLDEGYAVSVLITGRVKVWKWSNGGWIG